MRNSIEDNAMGTSATVSGKRGRAPADVVGYLDGPPQNQEKRCCVDARRSGFFADKDLLKEHAHRRNPELQARWGATHNPGKEGRGAAISAWNTAECNRVSGQELTGDEGKLHGVWRAPPRNGDQMRG